MASYAPVLAWSLLSAACPFPRPPVPMPSLQPGSILSQVIPGIDLALLATPSEDALHAVEDAAFWLKAQREALPQECASAFEAVDKLDALTQPPRLRLMRDYLGSGGRMRSDRQRRVVQAAIEYAKELAESYNACLRSARGNTPVVLVATLAARALRAHTLQLRWMLLHYAAPDARLWTRMHGLFAECERLGIERVRFKPYPGMAGDSTIRREYLRALMIAVSSVGSLLPQGQAVAERLIAAVAEWFVIGEGPDDACHFVVDLRSAWSPQRRFDRSLAGQHLRYFGPGDAVAKLRAWSSHLSGAGSLPEEAGSIDADAAVAAEVMGHLERHWGPEPPRRQHERIPVLRTLHVARGFAAACIALADRQAEPGAAGTTETWTTEDESAEGFGAFLRMHDGDDFAVGDLVAARTDRPGPWRIGVIRRLSTRDNGYHSIGVQVLAFGAMLVELTDTRTGSSTAALVVPSRASSVRGLAADRSEQILIVLPPSASVQASCWRMRVQEQDYLLRNGCVHEVGGDFQAARFEVSKTI